MSHKPKYDNNFLTSQNGCVVIEQSSQRERGPASSILSTDPKSVWVTSDKLPQQCIISLKKIIKKPTLYNMIGIYCWHQYDSNPALIQILGKSVPQLDKWHLITKIRLNLIDTWQYFKIDDLNADKIKQIKVRIVENYGDSKTYMNKISLHYVNPAIIKENAYGSVASSAKINYSEQVQQDEEVLQKPTNLNLNPNPKSPFYKDQRRQKVHSEYHKAEQNYLPPNHLNKSNLQMQQELKKANENIIKLTRQQEQMKKIMQKQQRHIIQMQQKMKIIIVSFQKMNQMREMEQKLTSGYKNSQSSKYKEYFQNQQEQNNHTNPKLKTKQKNSSQKYKLIRKQPSSENQQQYYQNLQRQKLKQKVPTQKQKQRYLKKNYPPNKYSEQIQQLSKMLNNYQIKSYINANKEKLSSSKQRDKQRQRQWEKQKQKPIKKVNVVERQQKKKQSHAKQQSQSYKHHTDIIRTNSEDDLSQYDDYQNYKTSQTSKNRAQLTPSPLLQFQKQKAKGQKAKMLQRLVKLIELKQKKKLELKRSGTKSRHNKQSLYQYQQEVQYDENIQDQQN